MKKNIIIETLSVGDLETNCYICITPENESVIIDPGAEAQRINQYIKDKKLDVKYILNTHGHGDHIGANAEVKEFTNAPICIHPADKNLLIDPSQNLSLYHRQSIVSSPCDLEFKQGHSLAVGGNNIEVIETPGHTLGCVCFIIGENLFTGDTLFRFSIGRTDFPHSSESKMQESLKKLSKLPENLFVYPGHGPSSVLKEELENNPFLQ